MRKTLLFLGVLLGIATLLGLLSSAKESLQSRQPLAQKNVEEPQNKAVIPASTYESYTGTLSSSIFVPYWIIPSSQSEITLPVSEAELTNIIYFGITPDENGINTAEEGYLALQRFVQAISPESETHLTLRMLDEDISQQYLENPDKAQQLITDVIDLALENDFEGIVLDLEHSVLPTKKVTDEISAFITAGANLAHDRNLDFGVTIYGDAYYRARPYDVRSIHTSVDAVYIMAYDYHKSYGEPGPNFPADTSDDADDRYGYTFRRMMDDFRADMPADKIHIVFGMFGYDWSVDKLNRPAKAAEAVTLNQAQSRYYPTCSFTDCVVERHPFAQEVKVTLVDDSGQRHTIWFEDIESVEAKLKIARTYGISHSGFWAFGYY